MLKGRVSLNMKSTEKKILILASNPKATPRLRLDEEIREIKEGLRRSKYRDQFEIHSVEAVRQIDLHRALLDQEPNIVHFIGHGKKGGLILENELGMAVRVSAKALTGLFKLCSNHVECVILSACYSASYAKAVSKHIDYVIGMKKEVEDKSVIDFAVGFYDALGAGKTVEEAFEFGRNAVQKSDPTGYNLPTLKKRTNKNKKMGNTCLDSKPNGDKPIQVVIRSFKHYSEELDNRVDKMLCLLDFFDGRRLNKGTWEKVQQEINTFLTQTIKAGNRYDFHIPLHSSLAFFVGRVLDPKCGAEINIYQSSPRRELWMLSNKYENKDEKIWTVEKYEVQDNGSELAAAVSVAKNTLADVNAYVKNQHSNISHLIHLRLDEIHHGAIKNASHAYQAAYQAVTTLREKYIQMGASRLHLFLAAPNVFTFLLGRQSIQLPDITLYEYDLEAGKPGAYTPTITI
jgi:hypothetical protein